jgi:hypothetical protein
LNTLQLFIYNTLHAIYFYLNTTGTFYLHTWFGTMDWH